MNLLHRYIFKNVVVTSLAAVAMFAFLLLTLSMVKDMLNLLAEGQLTVLGFFKLTWLLLPFVFVYALPMGFITGVLLTMGRLSAENEVTSLRGAGVSIGRMSSAVFVFAILGTTVSLIVNFYYGPLAKTNYRQELRDTIQSDPLAFITEKTFVKDFPGAVIYVADKDGQTLRDVWLWRTDGEQRVKEFIRAEWGVFTYDEGSMDIDLTLHFASVENRDRSDPENFITGNYIPLIFEKTTFTFPLDRILGKETFHRKLKWMTFSELRAEVAKWEEVMASASGELLEEARENLLKANMVFHKNFAMGFAVLSFAFIAVPLGIKTSRKETSANVGLGVAMGLAYYLCMTVIDFMDGAPQVRPDLMYWAPNVLYQAWGAWLFYKADHGRSPKG